MYVLDRMGWRGAMCLVVVIMSLSMCEYDSVLLSTKGDKSGELGPGDELQIANAARFATVTHRPLTLLFKEQRVVEHCICQLHLRFVSLPYPRIYGRYGAC